MRYLLFVYTGLYIMDTWSMNSSLQNMVDFPDYDESFWSKHVDQLVQVRNGRLNDISQGIRVQENYDILAFNIQNKENHSKVSN